jgi:hypothetical protein
LSPLDVAILRTVAYSDLFDYPLTLDELHRYLVGLQAPLPAVLGALHGGQLVPRYIVYHRGYVTLSDRQVIVETRLRRAEVAEGMWPKATRYGRAIAALPFVRMVAVTGTLAMDNVDVGADIDFLIVTTPHRLWLARLLTVALVHAGHLERLTVCPNYVIGLDSLDQFTHSLFTAHELAQMVPIHGLRTYHQLIRVNAWAKQFLPNSLEPAKSQRARPLRRPVRALKRSAEIALSGKLGDLWEQRESRAKIRQLSGQAATCGAGAATFTAQVCKGHLEDHGSQIAHVYAQRLARLGLEPPELASTTDQPRTPSDREQRASISHP